MFNICHYQRQLLKLLNFFFIISAKELAYGLEEQGIWARFPAEARRNFFCSSKQLLWNSKILFSDGLSYRGENQLDCENDNSAPSTVQIKNT